MAESGAHVLQASAGAIDPVKRRFLYLSVEVTKEYVTYITMPKFLIAGDRPVNLVRNPIRFCTWAIG